MNKKYWIAIFGSVIGVLCVGMFMLQNNSVNNLVPVADKMGNSANDTVPVVDKSHNYTEMVLEDNKLNEKNAKVFCNGTDQREMEDNGSVICVPNNNADESIHTNQQMLGNMQYYISKVGELVNRDGNRIGIVKYPGLESYTVEDLNTYRIEHKLKPLEQENDTFSSYLFAEELFREKCIHHIDSRGQGPMLRYQTNGDKMFLVSENVAHEIDPNSMPYAEIKDLDHQMMYNDSSENWGHRENILNLNATSVSVGIAYDDQEHAIVIVEDFETPLPNGFEYDPSDFQVKPVDHKECWN